MNEYRFTTMAEILTFMRDELLEQGTPTLCHNGRLMCQYLDQYGNKCAISMLLTDEERQRLSDNHSGLGADNPIIQDALKRSGIPTQLVTARAWRNIQCSMHDAYSRHLDYSNFVKNGYNRCMAEWGHITLEDVS